MAAFTTTLQRHKDEVAGDLCDMLLTFTDFLAFKEMFLDYRREKEGRALDLNSGLVVTSLAKASPTLLSCRPPGRAHRLEVGPRAADCSGRLAQKMICTVKSPLNHCSSPVPGLPFPTREYHSFKRQGTEESPF